MVMDETAIRVLLEQVQRREASVDDAVETLRHLPFDDLGFARLDTHRALRQGRAEVIFGQGKTPAQVATIAGRLLDHGANVLATRASAEAFSAVKAVADDAEFYERSGSITVLRHPIARLSGKVGLLAAGTSDGPVAEEAAVALKVFGVEVDRIEDVGVAGLHRLADSVERLANLDVAIVVAGMEGALPSVVGGMAACPIIAVPTSVGYGASFNGLAALLGMLNSCAAGVTVVNIDNGFGAAAAAHRILRQAQRGGEKSSGE
jgi:NCAIR mutase (PurE)-related protein